MEGKLSEQVAGGRTVGLAFTHWPELREETGYKTGEEFAICFGRFIK